MVYEKQHRLHRLMKSNSVTLFKESLTEFNADHGSQLAASVAFNLFFSLFPLATAAVFIAGAIPGWQDIQEHIIGGISYLLPGFDQLITGITNNAAAVRSGIGLLVLLGAIWGSISFFNAVTLSLNVAWGIHRPLSLFQTQLVNFLILIGAGIFVFLSVLFTIVLNFAAEPIVQNEVSHLLGNNLPMLVVSNILVTLFAFLLFLLFYKFMPQVRPGWKDIWAGALIAAVFFEITKLVFILFLRLFDPFNTVDRSVSTAIGFMMWTYMSALVFLFIAKITYVNFKTRSRTEGYTLNDEVNT